MTLIRCMKHDDDEDHDDAVYDEYVSHVCDTYSFMKDDDGDNDDDGEA